MARSDMSDLELEFIKAVLPNKTRGKPRVDDRRVINGIFYVLRTGIHWADLPEQYGPPTTVYNRFNRWSYAAHWDRIMEAIADAHNVDMVMVDGTCVRAHHSATTLKKRPAPLFRSLTGRIRDENTCTYQSGWASNPLLIDTRSAHDAPPCKTLLDNLQPGQNVLADKAYDADWIRDMIWEQGAIDVIPPKANRKLPAEFDAELYRERNKIERFFGRLKASFRRIATQYEKTSRNFPSMIKLASVRLWIEFYESAA